MASKQKKNPQQPAKDINEPKEKKVKMDKSENATADEESKQQNIPENTDESTIKKAATPKKAAAKKAKPAPKDNANAQETAPETVKKRNRKATAKNAVSVSEPNKETTETNTANVSEINNDAVNASETKEETSAEPEAAQANESNATTEELLLPFEILDELPDSNNGELIAGEAKENTNEISSTNYIANEPEIIQQEETSAQPESSEIRTFLTEEAQPETEEIATEASQPLAEESIEVLAEETENEKINITAAEVKTEAENETPEAVETDAQTSVEEKNAAVVHKLAATHSHARQKAQTIQFFIRFHSKPGQNLFITAQHPLFGNGNPDAALPMQFLNAETWTATVPVDEHFTNEPVVYNYLLKEPDGTFIYDFGKDKIINVAGYTSEEVSIIDSWNVEGYFENAFYTEPFKEVLLNNNNTVTEYAEPAVYTHTFKVKAPLLAQGEVVYIAGGINEMNNWEFSPSLLLHKKKDEDFWYVDIDLTNAQFYFEYKYGVYNIRKSSVVHIETGENRTLYDEILPNKKTIVNDGFIRLTNNTWKGAGIAIPVFSLKSENSMGAGEFTDIKTLVDWAKQIGLTVVQLLPVNDTTATKTWHDSYPYSSISAFALHAMYLNLNKVATAENRHFLDQYEEEGKRLNALPALDYEAVNDIKWKIIHHIYPLQKDAVFNSEDYKQFFETNKHWLIPYAAFCVLRDKNNTAEYPRWKEHKTYDANAVEELLKLPEIKDAAGMYYFVQYHLHLQLKEAKDYAHSNGIILKGDIAIGVSRYSVETWQQPELFNVDMQAGAPPDDFAVTGQNWGFPTYNWQKMQEDGFAWWKQRFEQMSYYFDAFRIDHILGFFRIWSIPADAVQGILGHFVPAIPMHKNEFAERGIYFDFNRYVKPFINDQVLNDLFGDQQWWVKDNLLTANGDGIYALKDALNTQERAQTYFAIRENNPHNAWLRDRVFDLISNVILFEEKDGNGEQFHFRYGMEETTSCKQLDPHTQWQLRQLSINYFYERQNDFWYNEAMKKLPALKQATNMLICGEDLGMVPASVPKVMSELGLLTLEVQRMPKDQQLKFVHLSGAPYLSVVTPSTHDMSTIRGWWEEDKKATQYFFNQELGQHGDAPQHCEPWINQMIVDQHLQSPAMLSIFQLQDLLGSDGNIRRHNPQDEQINKPAIPKFYWQYRMHLSLEDLIQSEDFNNNLKAAISKAGR